MFEFSMLDNLDSLWFSKFLGCLPAIWILCSGIFQGFGNPTW